MHFTFSYHTYKTSYSMTVYTHQLLPKLYTSTTSSNSTHETAKIHDAETPPIRLYAYQPPYGSSSSASTDAFVILSLSALSLANLAIYSSLNLCS